MSGRRPDTTRVFEFLDHFREVGVGHDWLSLPGWLTTLAPMVPASPRLSRKLLSRDAAVCVFTTHALLITAVVLPATLLLRVLQTARFFGCWWRQAVSRESQPQLNPWSGSCARGAPTESNKCPCAQPQVPPNNDWPTSWSPEHPYFPQNPPEGPFACVELGPSTPVPGVCAGHRTAHASTGCTWCAANVSKEASTLADQAIRDNAIAQLRSAAAAQVPFFIGAGLHRPHVPWVVPHEFFENLPAWQDVPLAESRWAPVGMPDAAWHFPADVTEMVIEFNGTCNATRSRLYRRAYYAAVAYQDYNVGMMLEELEKLNLAQDTLVVLLGDHVSESIR